MNRYFTVKKTNPNLKEIFSVCVKSKKTTELGDGVYYVVKLHLRDVTNYECLNGCSEYDNKGISKEMSKYREDYN